MKQPPGEPIRATFLAAIREAPADDAPRLIFADWLDDHGQAERAELIRAQVRAAKLEEDTPEREELEARAATLLAAHRKAWVAELPPWARAGAVFRRGFVAGVSCTAVKFLR